MTPTPPANRRNIILGTVSLSCVFCRLLFSLVPLLRFSCSHYPRVYIHNITPHQPHLKVFTVTAHTCQVWPLTPSPAPPPCVTAPSRRAPACPVTASWPGKRVTSGQRPPGTEAGPGSTRPPPGGLRIGWAASVARSLLTLLTLKVSGVWSRIDLASSALKHSPRFRLSVHSRILDISISFSRLFVVC